LEDLAHAFTSSLGLRPRFVLRRHGRRFAPPVHGALRRRLRRAMLSRRRMGTDAPRAPRSSPLARSSRAALVDVRCGLGPGDRPFPEKHTGWAIAMVRRGEFIYRAHDARRGQHLREGWLLLGRQGAEFECTHPRACGDDCTLLDVSGALLDSVRTDLGAPGPALPTSVLPPSPRVAAKLRLAEDAILHGASIDVDSLAVEIVAAILAAAGAPSRAGRAPSVRDVARVREAIDRIDARPCDDWALGDLAAQVGASPFHFARAFREVAGTTPHQYVISARLRRAVALLVDTRLPVTRIAYDVGFGDLSNFVRTFHKVVGCSPRALRKGLVARA
jgi:AraC-like DNA-binding protein